MVWRRWWIAGLVVSAAWLTAAQAQAQQGQGVEVDAAGVLRTRVVQDPTGMLGRQRLAAARASLDPEIARPSPMRMVSLTRLEQLAGERMATGQGLPDDMRYLAGLTRLRHVFVYPETGEIVIAGPAEGYVPDITGRVVGMQTGRAVLQLQDLVVALRAYPPGASQMPALVVSIDPSPEGLERMQQFLTNLGGQAVPADTERIVAGLQESLGLQTVRIEGIPARTHFAQVMVEADYRMKLIGIGLEEPPVRIPSYVSRANPRNIARNALQRWFFTPNYECVRVSEDELAMELVGDGVQLVNEDQLVQAGGDRVVSGQVDRASQAFVQAFTQRYSELADREPVYAQLRNLIDLAIAAAFMQEYDYYGQAGWHAEVFRDEQRFPVETYPEPKQVETAVNAIWRGNTLMTPIGGGISIRPDLALTSASLLPDEDGFLRDLRQEIDREDLDPERWWWD